MKYEFTADYFSNNIPRWEREVKPRFLGKPCKVLDIGSFEGRSATWLLDNVLTHPKAEITCVDDYSGKAEARKRIIKNLGHRAEDIYVSNIVAVLKKLHLDGKKYDLIYIDLGAGSREVLEVAVLAFSLLKGRGMMIFDDYTADKFHANSCPKQGIDAFVDIYARELKVLHTSWQMMVMKRSKALKHVPCKSEFYHENVAKI